MPRKRGRKCQWRGDGRTIFAGDIPFRYVVVDEGKLSEGLGASIEELAAEEGHFGVYRESLTDGQTRG